MTILPKTFYKPKYRLLQSISLQKPDKYHTTPLKEYNFHQVNLSEIRKQYDLVYDPVSSTVSHHIKFNGKFESGNLGQVYCVGYHSYEIHLLPDPNEGSTTQWFFFKVENIEPGEYFFVICGFYRSCNLHWKGSKPCVYSENSAKNGVGWQRLGENLNYFKWKSDTNNEWALSFTFSVKHKDTMYFAHSYPYTYTDLNKYIQNLPSIVKTSIIARSLGEISVPCIFWDADIQKCVDIQDILKDFNKIQHEAPPIRSENLSELPCEILDLLEKWKVNISHDKYPKGIIHDKKPVIVIAARAHPGETNSSYAIEGFISLLFGANSTGDALRKRFSFLLIPMLNPDGVICGFYRPELSGDDMNRVWQQPDPSRNTIVNNILHVLVAINKTRNIIFFLDFHGHTAACNSFVFGFMNEDNNPLYSTERIFGQLMAKYTNLFSNEMCSYQKQKAYEGTMRVVIRRKFHVLFAYTLELSYGGCDFGPYKDTQFTPNDYRSIGEATLKAIEDMFLSHDTNTAQLILAMLHPPVEKPVFKSEISASITIKSSDEHRDDKFKVKVGDITAVRPSKVTLQLNPTLARPVERDKKDSDNKTKKEMLREIY